MGQDAAFTREVEDVSMVGAASRRLLRSRKLRALATGLVLLVLALAPLHVHAAGTEPAGSCMLCEVGQRALDLPVEPSRLLPVPRESSDAPAILPGETPRTDARVRSPFAPRGPPLLS